MPPFLIFDLLVEAFRHRSEIAEMFGYYFLFCCDACLHEVLVMLQEQEFAASKSVDKLCKTCQRDILLREHVPLTTNPSE